MSEYLQVKEVKDQEDQVVSNLEQTDYFNKLHENGLSDLYGHKEIKQSIKDIEALVTSFNQGIDEEVLVGGLSSSTEDEKQTLEGAKTVNESDFDTALAQKVAEVNTKIKDFLEQSGADTIALQDTLNTELNVESFRQSLPTPFTTALWLDGKLNSSEVIATGKNIIDTGENNMKTAWDRSKSEMDKLGI